jgi:methyl-accepting chemotaxis protein
MAVAPLTSLGERIGNTSIRTRLMAAFGIVLALLGVVLAVGLWGGSKQQTAADHMTTGIEGLYAASEAKFQIADLTGRQAAYTLDVVRGTEGAAADTAPNRAAFLASAEAFRTELSALADHPLTDTQRKELAVATNAFDEYMRTDNRIVTLLRQGTPEATADAEALVLERSAALAEVVFTNINDLEHITLDDARDAEHEAASAASLSRWLMIGVSVVAFLFAFGMATLVVRSIVGPLADLRDRLRDIADGDGDLTQRVDDHRRDELGAVGTAFNRFAGQVQGIVRQVQDAARAQAERAKEMSTASEEAGQAIAQIAVTIDEMARGAGDQAEGTQRVTEVVEEMVVGVSRVAEGGQGAADAAREADEAAGQGVALVEQAGAAMERIEDRVDAAAQVVATLGERGRAIGDIAGTIDQLASQTNLLALNAAIEAARAGEQGRGFAVVAEEVRKLAEESQRAAASIGEIIRDIQGETGRAVEAMSAGRSEVEAGVTAVGRAGEAFEAIRTQVERVSGEVMQVAAAAQQLTSGAGEVQEQIGAVAAVGEQSAAATQEVAASTEQTSASSEQVSATAQALADEAHSLAALVQRFRV